jgi:hypothetical protein
MLKNREHQALLFVFIWSLISLAIANTARVVINENNADLHIKYSEFKDERINYTLLRNP